MEVHAYVWIRDEKEAWIRAVVTDKVIAVDRAVGLTAAVAWAVTAELTLLVFVPSLIPLPHNRFRVYHPFELLSTKMMSTCRCFHGCVHA